MASLTEGIDNPYERRQVYLDKFENGCRKVLKWDKIYIKRLKKFKIKRIWLGSN